MVSMKTLRVLGVVAAVVSGSIFVASSGSASVADDAMASTSRAYLHSYNLPSSGVALEGYCPVAYFAADKALRGSPEFASTFEGVTYYFVSADAKKMFDKEPSKYLPEFGGWCAFGMAVSDKFPVDPTLFKVVDGKLYLFLRNAGVDALELWNDGEEGELIKKANAHWNKVQG